MKTIFLKAKMGGVEKETSLDVSQDEWNKMSTSKRRNIIDLCKKDIVDMWVEAKEAK